MKHTRPLPDPDSLRIPRIESDAGYAALLANLDAHEKRLAASRERRLRADSVARGVPAGRSVEARAADLVAGGHVPALAPAYDRAAADDESLILRQAIVKLNEAIRDKRGDLSIVACRAVEKIHTQALSEAFRALQYAQVAFGVAAGVRAKVRESGHDPLETILPFGVPPAAAVLGSGYGDGRQLDNWRRVLEVHGVRLD